MPPKTNEELIEVTAKRIYEVMPYDLPGIKPEWVEGGNSLMQSIARGCASGILTTILTTKDKQREEAVAEALAEYKQFVINVLDGVDIADGYCNTKAIRFALESRTITPSTKDIKNQTRSEQTQRLQLTSQLKQQVNFTEDSATRFLREYQKHSFYARGKTIPG